MVLNYMKTIGVEVSGVYCDEGSTNESDKSFKEMFSSIARREADAMIMFDLHRFTTEGKNFTRLFVMSGLPPREEDDPSFITTTLNVSARGDSMMSD